jgi:regulator of protease activity HflC (stomatin/prohibitin superfamily)
VQALINFIIAQWKALWPISRVYSWEKGLLIRGGIIRRELAPGLHVRWPVLDEVYRANCAEQTIDLPTAAVTTSCGKSVAASANLAYRTCSPKKLWSKVSNIERSVTNLTLGFLAGELTKRSWEDLTQRRDDVQSELAAHMSKQLEPWGVEVTRVYLTDLVEARHYRLFGDAAAVRT